MTNAVLIDPSDNVATLSVAGSEVALNSAVFAPLDDGGAEPRAPRSET